MPDLGSEPHISPPTAYTCRSTYKHETTTSILHFLPYLYTSFTTNLLHHPLSNEILTPSQTRTSPHPKERKKRIMSPQPPIPLPASYTSLPYTQISLTHHPASSPFPTPIIILTLSRPKNHNAFTDTMMLEMEEAFTMLDLDERVRVVVVTGEGRMFCAGADLEVGFGEGTEGRRGGGRASGHRDG